MDEKLKNRDVSKKSLKAWLFMLLTLWATLPNEANANPFTIEIPWFELLNNHKGRERKKPLVLDKKVFKKLKRCNKVVAINERTREKILLTREGCFTHEADIVNTKYHGFNDQELQIVSSFDWVIKNLWLDTKFVWLRKFREDSSIMPSSILELTHNDFSTHKFRIFDWHWSDDRSLRSTLKEVIGYLKEK